MLYRAGQQAPGKASPPTDSAHEGLNLNITAIGTTPVLYDGVLTSSKEKVAIGNFINWEGQSPAFIGIAGGRLVMGTFDEVEKVTPRK